MRVDAASIGGGTPTETGCRNCSGVVRVQTGRRRDRAGGWPSRDLRSRRTVAGRGARPEAIGGRVRGRIRAAGVESVAGAGFHSNQDRFQGADPLLRPARWKKGAAVPLLQVPNNGELFRSVERTVAPEQ